MRKITELHKQAEKVLDVAQDCLDHIKIISEDKGSIENKEELKEVYLKSYRMVMSSYFRILRRIQEIGDGTEW